LNTHGRHLLVEYHGCDSSLLDDCEQIERAMNRAAVQAGATVVASTFHRFAPQGVSGVVVVEESHISIHTWPECGYAAVDFYTCGECSPERAHHYLREVLEAESCEVMAVERGAPPARPMRVARHYHEGADAPVPAATAK
jgi:S-adenosylmethionine decarboxylase